jgi:hypothetical protein
LISDPEDRATASIAREHMWFELNEEELNELHRAVVVKGSVPTPYRRWAKCKKESELESMAKIPSRGTEDGSEGDDGADGLDAELEGDADLSTVESTFDSSEYASNVESMSSTSLSTWILYLSVWLLPSLMRFWER